MYGSTGQREALLGSPGRDAEGATGPEVQVEVHKNNLGVFNGVFVPCLLNILGVILFLRIGFSVGYTGWLGVFLLFAVGETVAMLTVLSMSALVSNGNMRGGGSYFLISRCLGAEFGGSIGFCFMLSYAIGSSFYCIGVASAIVDAFLTDETTTTSEKQTYNRIISSIALALVMVISYLGAEFFTRINGIVFAIQFGAIMIGIASMLFASPLAELENGGEFTGFSLENLRDNAWTNFTYDDKCGGVCSWRSVFGIIFPGVTGISEGANLSGDLRNPNRDIGRGTIAAVIAAMTTYAFLIVSFAGGFPRDTLKTNMNVMANVAWPNKYVIIVGIAVSAFSSALGSVFGGSRILQALARDDLPPKLGLSFFAKGSARGDEPRRAVVLMWLIAQAGCLIGDLDIVSPIITSFFLVSYGAINLTCLLMDVSGTPNFRPQFRFYSRTQSFVGFALCFGLLFFLDVWYAVAACSFLIALYIWIAVKAPAKTWGDVSQSIMYHQVRKYLLRLDVEDHPKNWRPSLLLLLGPGKLNIRLVNFCNSLKKGGLYSIGDAVLVPSLEGQPAGTLTVQQVEEAAQQVADLRAHWLQLVKDLHMKAIPEVTFAPSPRIAFQQLVLLSGLGGMKPNCVVLMLPTGFGAPSAALAESYNERRRQLLLREDSQAIGATAGAVVNAAEIAMFESPSDFLDVLRDVLSAFHKHVLLTCNFDHQFHKHRELSNIDVWVIGEDLGLDGRLSLQLQLAHILRLERRGSRLRIFNIVSEQCDLESQEQALVGVAEKARLHGATCHVIALRGARPLDQLAAETGEEARLGLGAVNQVMASNSLNSTRVSLIGLPAHPVAREKAADANYVSSLQLLVAGLPPVVLVQSSRRHSIIPSDL